MVEHRSRFVTGFAMGVLVSGCTVAAVYLATVPRQIGGTGGEPLVRASSEMRGIVQALAVYAQNNEGQFPAASPDWYVPLVDARLAPIEFFGHPTLPKGAPRYFYLQPQSSRAVIVTTDVVLVQNPATTGGRGGLVAYNDNSVTYLIEPEFSRLIESLLRDPGARVLK